MNNVNTEEFGRIVANAVSNFLSLPDQNNDNSTRLTATQTRITQPQVSIYINKDIFRYFHYLLDRPGLRCCHCQCARIHDSRHIRRTSCVCLRLRVEKIRPRSQQSCLTLLHSRYSSRIVHGENYDSITDR